MKKFQTKVVEKIKTHSLISITFFRPENRAVYEIMLKNMVKPDRPQTSVLRVHFACWIPKGAYTYSEYVIFVDFLQQQWLHESASVLRYMYTRVNKNPSA